MSLKKLITILLAVVIAMVVVTVLFGVIANVALKPVTNSLVESQLGNTNAAPTVIQLYHNFGSGIQLLAYLAVLSPAVWALVRFFKSKEKQR